MMIFIGFFTLIPEIAIYTVIYVITGKFIMPMFIRGLVENEPFI